MDYVQEMMNIKLEGMECNGQPYHVDVSCYVCDAPARAFLAQIKSHTGYSSCGKCVIRGEYFENRVIFEECNSQLRTDVSFIQKPDEDHHIGDSPLVNIPGTKMVTNFPLEYMHLVCFLVPIAKDTFGLVQRKPYC
jgi:hypothetical protein